MAAALKTLAYLGVVLLVGAGVFRLFIGPELSKRMRRTLRAGTLVGGVLIVLVSLADVTWSVSRLIGRFDPALTTDYLLNTNHGRMALVRLALTPPLVALTLGALPARLHRALYLLTSLGVLTTFSYLSHAAVQHGAAALLGDLGHFAAAALWGGAVLYTALLPTWRYEPAHADLTRTMGRVSSLGLWCVVLLMATGVYAGLLHLSRPAELTTTPYGLALVLKLVLVGTILALAGFNRWWLLPALKKGRTQRLGQMLRLEAALLITVFAATGILTTRPLPHG